MAVIRRGDTIMAKSWDRLGTILEVPSLLQLLAKKGVNVVVCQGGSTDNPEGMLMTHLLLSVSQFELQKIRSRTKDALAERRRQGRRDTRRRYGWTATPDGRFVPNEDEQRTIGEIQEAIDMGETLRAICDELESKGVPAPEAGSRWHPSTISRILKRVTGTQVA
jgi:DNA invertase Pin-like site-specific DNA recombinase